MAMPCDRDAVLELLLVLGMNLRTVVQRPHHPLGWRQRGEFIGIDAERIGAEQHGPARIAIARARIADQAGRQIGIADAAVDTLVLLPEAALELQADLDA